jgi:predicted nucleic acid-binding protein
MRSAAGAIGSDRRRCVGAAVSRSSHVRRYAAIGEIDEQRGSAALADLAGFSVRRYPHDFLLARVWSLRSNFTAYDAVYVSLAEALNARLLTRDQRLAAAVRRHAGIELA